MANNKQEWWRNAVIYQIYPRSFADASGDGYGDLRGIINKLPYLVELGVDAIWLSPFYLSPMADAGYDVDDYRQVDPLFGKTEEAMELIEKAHEQGLRIFIDLVPNHTSDEHEWFKAARAAGAGSKERDRYMFRDGKGDNGELPPNNWQSVFGGDGWSRVKDKDGKKGQWYLHLFDVKQPDLNWENEEVKEEFRDILRYWLDAGVDGFRVDVAHSLVKAEGLPDENKNPELLGESDSPMFDQDGVHDIYRDWHKVLAEYDGDRAMVAEAWVGDPKRLARYVRQDEMHQAFNFEFLISDWDANSYKKVIDETMEANEEVGAPTTWVLSNHDVVRHASRLGREDVTNVDGIGEKDPQPDNVLGLKRAKAATLMMLALPGAAYIYQGEELGLPEVTDVPDELRQDPVYFRTNHEKYGRDGCRVPIPWDSKAPAYGFSPNGESWLPQPDIYGELAVDQQKEDTSSTWAMYHNALMIRKENNLGLGSLEWLNETNETLLSFENNSLRIMININGDPVDIPEGYEILISSSPTENTLEKDTAVWLKRI